MRSSKAYRDASLGYKQALQMSVTTQNGQPVVLATSDGYKPDFKPLFERLAKEVEAIARATGHMDYSVVFDASQPMANWKPGRGLAPLPTPRDQATLQIVVNATPYRHPPLISVPGGDTFVLSNNR